MGVPANDCPRPGHWLWRAVALVLGSAVLSLGCGPLTLMSFLWPRDDRVPPEFALVCKDKKETKLVVLASSAALDTRPETSGAEQDLAERLITALKKRYDADKANVKIVPHYQVRDYHNKNPYPLTPYEVGKHFGADKVVYLELGRLSLYKEGSARTLFCGRLEMTVTVTDLKEPRDAGPVFHKDYFGKYPKGPEQPADGTSSSFFRAHLLDHAANEVADYFTPHEPPDSMDRGRSWDAE